MPFTYKPYVPRTIGEIWDLLGFFLLSPPTFKDDFFVGQSVETEFFRLNEGLKVVRTQLGEERYSALIALSDRMRALFEADPEDRTGDARAGRRLIYDMERILRPGKS